MSVPGTIRSITLTCIAMVASALSLAGSTEIFHGQLDPVPFDNSTRPFLDGSGNISARLDGDTLTISGTFSGLASPATAAQLHTGLAMGVPGPVIGELTIEHSVNGAISGQLRLSAGQLAALRASAVYIQLASVKLPGGHLWGWLEAHRGE
jgi:hypothetical protein